MNDNLTTVEINVVHLAICLVILISAYGFISWRREKLADKREKESAKRDNRIYEAIKGNIKEISDNRDKLNELDKQHLITRTWVKDLETFVDSLKGGFGEVVKELAKIPDLSEKVGHNSKKSEEALSKADEALRQVNNLKRNND